MIDNCPKDFDVIVVGGGHAGVEAALAVSRMGMKSALVTMDPKKLAMMSCNPAIGGLGKSQLVKEIDALGGVMGEAIDATGIQFRMLNLSRGPAVWSTRVQADRIAYNRFVVDYVDATPNLEVIEGLAGELLVEAETVRGIRLENGESILSGAVIIASGTFLGGLIHIGEIQRKSGRLGEPAAYSLSESIRSLGFEVGRLKTGTPPRIDGDTIDFSKCEPQPGDEPIPFMSHRSQRESFSQSECFLTYTTAETKSLVTKNAHLSAMFSGRINSVGPRYCPSIEDKFHRFADKEQHQIFLEPEGNGTTEIYPNGFSTSLPEDVQREAIRTITGLEEAVITIPGYAVEYDYCPAHQIKPSLETNRIAGLFFAGQINGTSGYEEAAAQGLLAGVNAVLSLRAEPAFTPDRSQAYLGVMIDDLTTLSTTEPYRMFTSRAEYRLSLREDNARDRLSDAADQYGLISKQEYQHFCKLREDTDSLVDQLRKTRLKVSEIGVLSNRFEKTKVVSLAQLLKLPGITPADIRPLLDQAGLATDNMDETFIRAAIAIRYQGYVVKQQREIEKFRKMESEQIPDSFPYDNLLGLKNEAREKFLQFRPQSLGQAGRIEGVTPGDVAVLSVHLKRYRESS